MAYCYVALQSRSHAFILERRLSGEGIPCELTYMPREIMYDLCNMGVKFEERDFQRALNVIIRSGFPDYRIYKENLEPWQSNYIEMR